MLAGKNSDLNETAETLYQLNAEEDIRLQCQAREDYYMFKTMTENKMAQLEASLADKDATIADQKQALADKDQALAESLSDIKKLHEEIRLLKSAQ